MVEPIVYPSSDIQSMNRMKSSCARKGTFTIRTHQTPAVTNIAHTRPGISVSLSTHHSIVWSPANVNTAINTHIIQTTAIANILIAFISFTLR